MRYPCVKRFLDIVSSVFLIIIFLPLFMLVSLIIKLDSKGPVFFRQKRAGVDKRLFTIYKFRTMKATTPPDLATHMLDTPKLFITKAGSFFRKTSIDELPQLFNILKGDMSFIGPRPALWTQEYLIKERDTQKINAIRPGLTGLAQISGRDSLDSEQKILYDKKYLDEMSFMLDLKILAKTPYRVITGKDIRNI